jgi:copper(I)-binding protein
MHSIRNVLCQLVRWALAFALSGMVVGAWAHDSHAGDIAIGHPFATPSLPGMTTGAAYFASLENAGSAAGSSAPAHRSPSASRCTP